MTNANSNQQDPLSAIQVLIQRGEIQQAYQALASLPDESRLSKMGLYMTAVCLRRTKDFARTEKTLFELTEKHPTYGRAFQELGHLYRENGAVYEALNAYGTACHLNPALKASWQGQYQLLQQINQPERLNQVKQRISWLDDLPPELIASMDLLHEGRLLKAERLCRGYLQKNLKVLRACVFLPKWP